MMKLCTWVIWLLVTLISAPPVLTAPLSIKISLENAGVKQPELTHYIVAAQNEANQVLSKIRPILERPQEPYYNYILRTCFGDKYHEAIHEIRTNVNLLLTGSIKINETRAKQPPDSPGAVANYHFPPIDAVTLWDAFYKVGIKESALMLIHEAAHALFKAEDWFTKDEHFTPIMDAKEYNKPERYTGYLRNDFKLLRSRAPASSMARNADSYMLLAYLATVGFHDMSSDLPVKAWGLQGVPVPQKP